VQKRIELVLESETERFHRKTAKGDVDERSDERAIFGSIARRRNSVRASLRTTPSVAGALTHE
jgi:hypothetical protein